MRRALQVLAASASIVLPAASMSGCGSTPPGQTTPDGAGRVADGSFLTCATDTRAVPYQPGMQVTSSAGTFTIKLLDSVPGPPVKGPNTWTLEVDDATSGTPLDGLAISVTPWM